MALGSGDPGCESAFGLESISHSCSGVWAGDVSSVIPWVEGGGVISFSKKYQYCELRYYKEYYYLPLSDFTTGVSPLANNIEVHCAC